jgi:GNAT superfamily N-acetyltransferase
VTIEVRPVRSRRERRIFRDLPSRLHGKDPAFIPILDAVLASLLDRRRNPFWTHAEGCEWLAWRDAVAVGRIGACVDRDLAQRAPGRGVVGLFDCIEERTVAGLLFETAERWLGERSCTVARGPLNYSIHDTAGLLVDGFEFPPVVDTTWTPPYYAALWEEHGYNGAIDTVGAAGPVGGRGWDRSKAFAERAERRGVHVRALDLSRFLEEVELVRQIYTVAWDSNWGHVPVSSEEFAFKARDLKPVLDPGLVRIAECDGRPVGFALGLPDLNPAIRKSGGRLLPLGWLRLLRARHTSDRARVVAMGVIPGYKRRGVEAFLLSSGFAAVKDLYSWVEASWILEENTAMINGLRLYGLKVYKRWRIYEKELSAVRSPPSAGEDASRSGRGA